MFVVEAGMVVQTPLWMFVMPSTLLQVRALVLGQTPVQMVVLMIARQEESAS
jgi:hypothetical protein